MYIAIQKKFVEQSKMNKIFINISEYIGKIGAKKESELTISLFSLTDFFLLLFSYFIYLFDLTKRK
jgi:hypothetical protein